MVIGAVKTLINTLLQYHLVTLSLNIPRFLGLNMIEPPKPLIDSGLAVRFLSVSNKTATKVQEKAPFRVQVKIKFHIRLATLVQR